MADTLSRELGATSAGTGARLLYAICRRRTCDQLEAPTPEGLLERYNLALSPGRAVPGSQMVITAHARPRRIQTPVSLPQALGLMAYIEVMPITVYLDHRWTCQSVQAQPSLWAGTRQTPASAAARHALAFDSHPCAATGASSTPQGAGSPWRPGCGWLALSPGTPYDSSEQALRRRWPRHRRPGGGARVI